MRKILAIALLIAILSILSLTACTQNLTGAATQPKGEPVKICAMLPLTGAFATVGQDIARGLELAIAENNAGSDTGDTPLTLVIEDDAYEPRKMATAAQKLIEVDGCAVIITLTAEETKPIIPIAREKNVRLIMALDRSDSIPEGDAGAYSLGYSIDAAAEKMAAYVRHKLGAKRVVIVYDPVEFTMLSAAAFQKSFTAAGGEVAQAWQLAEGEDMRTIAAKIREEQPEVVYFALAVNDQPSFIERLREQGVDVYLVSPNSLLDDFIIAAGDAAERSCKTDLPPIDPEREARVHTVYVARYGSEPISLKYVLITYDVVRAISSAAAQGGSAYGETLSNVSGVTSSFGDTISLVPGAEPRVESIYCVENGSIALKQR